MLELQGIGGIVSARMSIHRVTLSSSLYIIYPSLLVRDADQSHPRSSRPTLSCLRLYSPRYLTLGYSDENENQTLVHLLSSPARFSPFFRVFVRGHIYIYAVLTSSVPHMTRRWSSPHTYVQRITSTPPAHHPWTTDLQTSSRRFRNGSALLYHFNWRLMPTPNQAQNQQGLRCWSQAQAEGFKTRSPASSVRRRPHLVLQYK